MFGAVAPQFEFGNPPGGRQGVQVGSGLPNSTPTSNSGTAAPQSGWTQHTSKDGRPYWHHAETGQSTWDKPDVLKTDLERLTASQTPWKEYQSSEGRIYWFNRETKQSVWQCPTEIQQLKDELEGGWVPFTDKAVALERLKVLFKLKGIGLRNRWDEVLNVIKGDERFSCFVHLTAGEKRQCFAEYQTQIKKQQRERERAKKAEARRCFLEAVTKWPQIHPAALLSAFEKDNESQWWLECLGTSERQDLFNDHLEEFESVFLKQQREQRNQQREEMARFLETSPQISLDLSWREASTIVLAQERFQNIQPLDFIKCWEDLVAQREAAEAEERRQKLLRKRRILRDRFREFVQQHLAERLIDAKTLFTDFAYANRHAHEYVDLVGVPCATAREIFEEIMGPVVREYEECRSAVRGIVKTNAIEVTLATTFESFLAALKLADRAAVSEMSKSVLQLVFDSLKRRAAKKLHEKQPPLLQDISVSTSSVEVVERGNSSRNRSPSLTGLRRATGPAGNDYAEAPFSDEHVYSGTEYSGRSGERYAADEEEDDFESTQRRSSGHRSSSKHARRGSRSRSLSRHNDRKRRRDNMATSSSYQKRRRSRTDENN